MDKAETNETAVFNSDEIVEVLTTINEKIELQNELIHGYDKKIFNFIETQEQKRTTIAKKLLKMKLLLKLMNLMN